MIFGKPKEPEKPKKTEKPNPIELEDSFEEVINGYRTQLQEENESKMMSRFSNHLSFMSFVLLVRKITKDPEERFDIVHEVVSIWEKREKDLIKKQKEIIKEISHKSKNKEKMEDIIRIQESALQESKLNIMFALKDIYK